MPVNNLSEMSFGVFTDDKSTFDFLRNAKAINIPEYTYGAAKASGDPKRPYTCVNGTSNTNWKYFVSVISTPFHCFD